MYAHLYYLRLHVSILNQKYRQINGVGMDIENGTHQTNQIITCLLVSVKRL